MAGWPTGAGVASNTTGRNDVGDPAGYRVTPVMFVADEAARKLMVLGLACDLGLEALDAGPLPNARLLEP